MQLGKGYKGFKSSQINMSSTKSFKYAKPMIICKLTFLILGTFYYKFITFSLCKKLSQFITTILLNKKRLPWLFLKGMQFRSLFIYFAILRACKKLSWSFWSTRLLDKKVDKNSLSHLSQQKQKTFRSTKIVLVILVDK